LADLVYISTIFRRALLSNNSSLWTPYFKSDIESIESVQRKFTKLHGLLRDLILCYKSVFGLISDHFFIQYAQYSSHPYTLTD